MSEAFSERLVPREVPPATDTLTGRLLREGAEIADGARQQTHGSKERSFTGIAEAWTLYLEHKYQADLILTGEDIAWLMVLMKLMRRLYGSPLKDHALDAAVYAAMTYELQQAEEEKDR